MPTYRYRCGRCGEDFEVWQSIRDEPLRVHDHGCGGEVVKVLTPAGIVLKGSGFYKTDSRAGSSERSGRDGEKSGEHGREKGGEQTGPGGDGSPAKKEPSPAASTEKAAPSSGSQSSTGAAAS